MEQNVEEKNERILLLEAELEKRNLQLTATDSQLESAIMMLRDTTKQFSDREVFLESVDGGFFRSECVPFFNHNQAQLIQQYEAYCQQMAPGELMQLESERLKQELQSYKDEIELLKERHKEEVRFKETVLFPFLNGQQIAAADVELKKATQALAEVVSVFHQKVFSPNCSSDDHLEPRSWIW